MQLNTGADASVNANLVLPTAVVKTYLYTNTAWGDQLTSYDGHNITYDALGNPLSYYNGESYAFTWDGRRMTSATKGGLTYTFTYNDEGLRTSKTVDGVTTYYYYEGTLLVAEQSDLETIVYLYDSTGAPIGFRYRTPSYAENVWDDYYYEKNMQGDIVRVYNSEGVKLVSYVYTAWGDRASTTYHHGGANTTVTNNPFTYRGYYYDNDLDLYYLQSRYYDSKICRFISPDEIGYLGANGDLNSYNLYAYCSNDPINCVDPTGTFSLKLGIIIAGAIVGALTGMFSSATTGGDVLEGAIEGAITGAVGATCAVYAPIFRKVIGFDSAEVFVAAAVSFAVDLTTQVTSQYIRTGEIDIKEIDWGRAAKTGFTTALGVAIPALDNNFANPALTFGTALLWGEASILIAVTDVIITNIRNIP